MSDIPYGRTAVVTIDLHRGHLDPDASIAPGMLIQPSHN